MSGWISRTHERFLLWHTNTKAKQHREHSLRDIAASKVFSHCKGSMTWLNDSIDRYSGDYCNNKSYLIYIYIYWNNRSIGNIFQQSNTHHPATSIPTPLFNQGEAVVPPPHLLEILDPPLVDNTLTPRVGIEATVECIIEQRSLWWI